MANALAPLALQATPIPILILSQLNNRVCVCVCLRVCVCVCVCVRTRARSRFLVALPPGLLSFHFIFSYLPLLPNTEVTSVPSPRPLLLLLEAYP